MTMSLRPIAEGGRVRQVLPGMGRKAIAAQEGRR